MRDDLAPRTDILTLALAALICLSPATLVWPFCYPEEITYISTNHAAPGFPPKLLVFHAISVLALGAYYLYRFRRSQRSGFRGMMKTCRSCNGTLLPLLALPSLSALRVPRVESEAPFFTLLLIALATLPIAAGVYRWAGQMMRATRSIRLKRAPELILILLATGYTALVSYYAILNHRYLRVPSFDLAIYDNLVWNTSHGNFLVSQLLRGGTHMSAHFDPILAALAPFYLIRPDAETLLTLQSAWLASGVLPLFLLASKVQHVRVPLSRPRRPPAHLVRIPARARKRPGLLDRPGPCAADARGHGIRRLRDRALPHGATRTREGGPGDDRGLHRVPACSEALRHA
jgi:hypothetical protein